MRTLNALLNRVLDPPHEFPQPGTSSRMIQLKYCESNDSVRDMHDMIMNDRLTMDHSERSITNVGGQTQRPAGADNFLVELRGSIRDSGADAFVVHGAPMPLDRFGK
ncbi:hypothetical protein CJ030_MR7G025997 [Morella rubra]|uniref:Uncharacterized protein n=1 Tax=Morella rubra TaxID=262757 RepID=A0A6A1UYI8_9ROSI|nr:hypothetical protein CJ030_MR7G025997 [Morella rubra]